MYAQTRSRRAAVVAFVLFAVHVFWYHTKIPVYDTRVIKVLLLLTLNKLVSEHRVPVFARCCYAGGWCREEE